MLSNDTENKKKNYYELLGISKNAELNEIKQAYKKLALKYHPDRNKDDNAENIFKDISKAYQVLSNPEQKKKYDMFGENDLDENLFNGNFQFDIFNQFFGDFSKSFTNIFTENNINRKSPDKLIDVPLSLSVIYTGKKQELKFKKNVKCTHCKGTGSNTPDAIYDCASCFGQGIQTMNNNILPGMLKQMNMPCRACKGKGKMIDMTQICKLCNGEKIITVDEVGEIYIPPGIDYEDTISIKGGASITDINQESGDIILKIKQKENYYERLGPHLYIKYPISLLDALTETHIYLQHPKGNNLKINIKEVVNPETVIELKNFGMPYINNIGKFGNLYISFNIKFPEKLSKERQKYLKQLLPLYDNTNVVDNCDDVSDYSIYHTDYISQLRTDFTRVEVKEETKKEVPNLFKNMPFDSMSFESMPFGNMPFGNMPFENITTTIIGDNENPGECLQQ